MRNFSFSAYRTNAPFFGIVFALQTHEAPRAMSLWCSSSSNIPLAEFLTEKFWRETLRRTLLPLPHYALQLKVTIAREALIIIHK